jgi:glycolate oxidase
MDIQLTDELERIAKGEILIDNWSKTIYSVDASHYSIEPSAIAYPLDEHDLSRICQYGYSKNISITARGAGTGLLGQSLNNQIILDLTKHMNKILEIGPDYVLVQPGLVKGVLDKELKKRGKFLPPDPASTNYCTIGGMIANNSSGVHALGYGSTIEFLDLVNIVYSNGSFGCIGSRDTACSYDERITKLYNLVSPYTDLIQMRYPRVTKNSCGYRLDAVINNEKFCPQKIFAASEGTLGIVASAKLKIIDIPLFRATIVFGFEDLLSAISVVPVVLRLFPVALEMLDHTVSRHQDTNSFSRGLGGSNNGGTLLFVEFAGNTLVDVEQRVTECKNKLSSVSKVLESVTDESSSRRIWEARKSALNNAMKLTVGSRKPAGLIEDTVVNPNILYDYTRFLLQKYNDNKLDYVMYGHAGNGNLHTRPIIDMASRTELELFNIIGAEVFTRVISCGGTITGEHGDGIARSKYIKSMYGTQLVSIFEQIKKLFDPRNIMNPGKKVTL